MLNASQIAVIVNEIYDGVERSKLGSIIKKDENGNEVRDVNGDRILNYIPFNTYLAIINSLFPKNMVIQEEKK